MLVAQAKYAAELFLGAPIEERRILEIYRGLLAEKAGLALVGMPSCGKTGVGKALAKALKKPFVDADAELVRRAGRPISEILRPGDESPSAGWRPPSRQTLPNAGGAVLATGGAWCCAKKNVRALRQNYVVLYLDRPLALFEARRRQAAERHARGAGAAPCGARCTSRHATQGWKTQAVGGGRRKGGIYEVLDREWA